ncbi:hypothetical protein [Serratia rubidaea]|uniref:N-acetyltransferase domain-containing protein n=1 Tax=Serratia rubidaea TaxID=61652 RepID=A0A448SRV7_SERRU|nr:hypothetical protein [Serratia rubidaea]MBH1932539.1 hypothetical protein [Serratia rubidaea]MDC6119162.1 hypothetical protein [Serratia rubidaea]MEB7584954.1 hypothetical protein [Serratia rubidaea]VEI70439.1 Uncharacterised protein [Serratia rubidaea]
MSTVWGNFVYQLLETRHEEAAIDVLCSVFSAQEPLAKALATQPDELRPFVSDLVRHATEGGLSWVAIEEKSARLAGVRILTDTHRDFIPADYPSSKVKTIFSFLHSLYDDESESMMTAAAPPLLHCWMVAVLPAFQRQGVLRNLYRTGGEWATRCGFIYGIEEVTNRHNLAFLNNETDVTVLKSLDYADYKFHGAYPFRNAEESQYCALCRYPLIRQEARPPV